MNVPPPVSPTRAPPTQQQQQQRQNPQHKTFSHPISIHEALLRFDQSPEFHPVDQKQPFTCMDNLSPVSLEAAESASVDSDDCSSCCDDDNCFEKCEDVDCKSGCGDCTDACFPTAACDRRDCGEAELHPICTTAPFCTAMSVCMTAPLCTTIPICTTATCDKGPACEEVPAACPEARCPGTVDIYCHKDDCGEEACEEESCLDICSPGCGNPDYEEGDQGFHHGHSCVSYRVNEANSNCLSYNASTSEYDNVHPTLLTLDSNAQQFRYNPSVMSRESHFHFGGPDVHNHQHWHPRPDHEFSEPPAKRQKAITPISTSTFENGYSTAPSSMAATPYTDESNSFACRWNNNCNMSFLDYHTLANHAYDAHIVPYVDTTCLWAGCGQESQSSEGLWNHFIDTHGSGMNSSTEHLIFCLWEGCNDIFRTEDEFKEHFRTHITNSQQCQWDSCGTLTQGSNDLQTHFLNEHSGIMFPLLPDNSNDLMFSPEPSSATTIASSTSPEPSPVPSNGIRTCEWVEADAKGNISVCGRTFPTSQELQQHAKDLHIAALKKKTGYYCCWEGCNRRDKPFSQKGKVERHLQTHTGFKSCTCPHCQKEFSAPQALQQHIRTHTGEKPFKCEVCGKDFAQGSAMTMHKRVHTGERPLMCDFPGCGKRFSESSNLSKHRKTHNPVGQHRCGYPGCDRSFHRLDQMKRHKKTHGMFVSSSNLEPSS